MNPAPEPLPNDVAALRAMLVAAWAERDAERAEKAQLAAQNDRLRHLTPDSVPCHKGNPMRQS